MSLDDLSWFTAELGLPTLEEADDGLLANRLARQTLASELPGRLDEAAAALVGTHASDPQLIQLLDAARDGERAAAVLGPNGKWRVLATPLAGSRAKLTFAPVQMEQDVDVQRRASLVDAASTVSHEVANALSAIGGWAELGHRSQENGEDPSEALRLIASCAKTAQQAAQRLLRLARGEASEDDGGADVGELAAEIAALLRLDARQLGVDLEARVSTQLNVEASRAELFSVVWNLTKNALEACKSGDRVTLREEEQEGDMVCLVVEDTGAGLSDEAISRIFTPYYTTKSQGTGLGLALVKKTLESLGGTLDVESDVGMGTRFFVRLPAAARRSDLFPQQAPDSEPPRERSVTVSETAPTSRGVLDARVLVVDDDDALRGMVTTVLQLKGAKVTAAANRDEALRAEGPFDVALIDMVLKDERGDELLSELRQRGMVQAAILVTGVVQKPKPVPGGEPDDWVRKPFEVSQLVDRLRRTLERHRMLSSAAIRSSG